MVFPNFDTETFQFQNETFFIEFTFGTRARPVGAQLCCRSLWYGSFIWGKIVSDWLTNEKMISSGIGVGLQMNVNQCWDQKSGEVSKYPHQTKTESLVIDHGGNVINQLG